MSCETELADLAARESDAELAEKPLFSLSDESCKECCFYHFINIEEFWAQTQEKPDSRALSYCGLSVLVDGGPFGKLNLKREMRQFRDMQKWSSIGAIRFRASDIMDQKQFKFQVKHDPHRYRDKKTQEVKSQAKAHAQIFCNKGSTVRQALLKVCEVVIKPGDDIEEIESTVNSEKIDDIGERALSPIATIGLVLVGVGVLLYLFRLVVRR